MTNCRTWTNFGIYALLFQMRLQSLMNLHTTLCFLLTITPGARYNKPRHGILLHTNWRNICRYCILHVMTYTATVLWATFPGWQLNNRWLTPTILLRFGRSLPCLLTQEQKQNARSLTRAHTARVNSGLNLTQKNHCVVQENHRMGPRVHSTKLV